MSDIYGRTEVKYGGKYMTLKKVYEWVESFKGGQKCC
jgi:hypothetical protein